MKSTALITGASKGIGLELARIFAAQHCHLVLVARSRTELEHLKKELEDVHGISVHTIVKDLSLPGAAQDVYQEVKRDGIDIDFLVNNAGFGDFGCFTETRWERYEQMIGLNITALTHLCHLFASDWNGRKSAKILNVSSMAAFQPGPVMAVYFATKSYVLHFSEAIGHELKDKNITVTALCPGPTETHFMEDSQMTKSSMVEGKKLPSAKEVAEAGYKAMMKGKPVIIHGGMNRLIVFIIRFLPRRWVTNLAGKMMS